MAMLEATEIVVISVGSALLLLMVLLILFALSHYRDQQKRLHFEARKRAARSYYLDEPAPLSQVKVAPLDSNANEAKPQIVQPQRLEEIIDENRNTKVIERPRHIDIVSLATRPLEAEAISTEHCISQFAVRLQQIHNSHDRVLADEFKILDRISLSRLIKSCSNGEKNRRSNRFDDVVPYDDTRVFLPNLPNDYINASHIDGYKERHRFIAAQGPIGEGEARERNKKSTVDDFWQMIWHYRIGSIVMLTDVIEQNMVKCAHYWPRELGDSALYDDVKVTLVAMNEDELCTRREFDVEQRGNRRQVRQYHFKEWGDGQAVESEYKLARFLQRIRAETTKPTLVHCSAGVGRTGVFIALWNIVDRAKSEGIVDVFREVDALRRQRRGMVQSLEQYICIYDTLLYLIEPPQSMAKVVNHY